MNRRTPSVQSKKLVRGMNKALLLAVVCSWNNANVCALVSRNTFISAASKSSRIHSSRMVMNPLQQTQSSSTDMNILDTDTATATSMLDHLQSKAAPIAASFQEGTFDPWITNCHVQTIGGFFVRRICPYVPADNFAAAGIFARALFRNKMKSTRDSDYATPSDNDGIDDFFWDERERIETPDGDWFHADTVYAKVATSRLSSKPKAANSLHTAPTVILLHGLESNSNSTLSTEMAQAYLAKGMNCVCLNFRGCSGTPNDQPGGYHLGFTDDLKQYLQILRERRQASDNSDASGSSSNSNSRLYLTGFSLGANAVLKCLGELGTTAVTDFNIHGAAVSCAPLDQHKNSAKLGLPGINRFIYTDNLLQGLKKRAVIQLERFHDSNPDTDAFDYPRAMAAETITDYDDAFIAPVYGFKDASDYYDQTSSIHFLERMAVPTMILNAKDDPFLDENVWPTEKSRENGGKAPLKMVRTEHGGHLGFCWHRVAEDDADGLLQHAMNDNDVNDSNQPQPPPSWASREQARFLAHVESHPDTAQLGKQ
jgi:predicted alpha/beta-fold hydrolase